MDGFCIFFVIGMVIFAILTIMGGCIGGIKLFYIVASIMVMFIVTSPITFHIIMGLF